MIYLLIVLAIVADLTDFEVHAVAFFAMAVFLIGANRVAEAIDRRRHGID